MATAAELSIRLPRVLNRIVVVKKFSPGPCMAREKQLGWEQDNVPGTLATRSS